MAPTILLVDLDAFFCSVEEIYQPELRGKPFVVGGSPDGRGVVTSASYPARKFGVRSAMPTAQALRLCPGLIIARSTPGAYSKKSREVMAILRDAAPVVQQISIDEAYLDISDDPSPGEEVARRLQKKIMEECGLPTSWGVACNKLVAKIACDVGKPMGVLHVPAGEEADFLAPLPVRMLPGVGPKTGARLEAIKVRTIGDLASLPTEVLYNTFGERGRDLATSALGRDSRKVVEGREARTMSAERTFAKDVADLDMLEAALRELSERVGRRLRRTGIGGFTVRIKLRWPDFSTITRQMRLAQPTDQDAEIFSAARALFHKEWRPGRKIRLLGVGVAQLGEHPRQLELFDRQWQQDARLLKALDDIRARYGPQAVQRATRHKRSYGGHIEGLDEEEGDDLP